KSPGVSKNEKRHTDSCTFTRTGGDALGTGRASESEGSQPCVFDEHRQTRGRGTAPVFGIPGNSSVWFPCFPALQCFAPWLAACATEGNSGTARARCRRIIDTGRVHARRIGAKRRGGTTSRRGARKRGGFCPLNCSPTKRTCRRKSASP